MDVELTRPHGPCPPPTNPAAMAALAASSAVMPASAVIMQPITLCGLDCRYCYLPDRRELLRMPVAVACRVAESIQPWTTSGPVEICWHAGEPLAAGRAHLGQLMDCFTGLDVVHSVQTNATLIDQAWCAFLTDRQVRVGVSIDGPEPDTTDRVDWAGKPAFARILRGIHRLLDAGHEVAVIAVVSDPTPQRARRLYEFVADLGCAWLGVNIEEHEGVNTRPTTVRFEQTTAFWAELVRAWRDNPVVQVREIDRALGFAAHALDDNGCAATPPLAMVDPLPTIAWDGTVTLISPELAGFTSTHHGPFACGNVLHDPLDVVIERGMRASWVHKYRCGLRNCRDLCPYFAFCGGGHPSNRHFEHGRLDATETAYCRNSKIALMEGVIRVAHYDTRTPDLPAGPLPARIAQPARALATDDPSRQVR